MARPPIVGVLALQGAFREHIQVISRLGAEPREIRQRRDLKGIDSLIIPGGESTTIGKLMVDLDIMAPLKADIADGMPVYGTCAGLILLCERIENSDQPRLGLLDATVRRNAFGRQVDSFEVDLPIRELGAEPFPCVFIRAPIILETGPDARIMAKVEQDGAERAVAMRQGNILATSFHPELTGDARLHEYFLKMSRD